MHKPVSFFLVCHVEQKGSENVELDTDFEHLRMFLLMLKSSFIRA